LGILILAEAESYFPEVWIQEDSFFSEMLIVFLSLFTTGSHQAHRKKEEMSSV
jgi:hypothetical protein